MLSGQRLADTRLSDLLSIDLTLVEAMVAVLERMTTSAWPDRVFSLGGVGDEMRDVREPSALA